MVGTGLRGSLIAGALEGILSDTLATAAMTWASGRTLTAEMLADAALGGALSGGVGGWLGWIAPRIHSIWLASLPTTSSQHLANQTSVMCLTAPVISTSVASYPVARRRA